VGGTTGVSVGLGVDVPEASLPPQALKVATSKIKRMMNLGRTMFSTIRDDRIIHVGMDGYVNP
jgi:hypothetical protein